MTGHCDIAIIGGGPVGAALALSLCDSGLHVQLLEARKTEHAATDTRALVLSYGSRLLLDRLGLWNKLAPITPIRAIHISQKNYFGRTLLRAQQAGVPELGYVVPYGVLQTTLTAALRTSNIVCQGGAQVMQLHCTAAAENATITYQKDAAEHRLQARLAVVADGGKLLEAKYPPKIHDYDQSAIIAHVTCTEPRAETAFERFTTQGPLALLPYQNGYELVWTVPHAAAPEMLRWNDPHFLAQLHHHFGDRVGKFLTVGPRACFPIQLKLAPDITLPHTVLLGNAAQTLHPVAGQGLNLGLRDAGELAQKIIECPVGALGSTTMLNSYHKQRRLDRTGGIHFTDSLVRIFSNRFPILSAGRAISLSVLDCLPGAKRFVARRMIYGANG